MEFCWGMISIDHVAEYLCAVLKSDVFFLYGKHQFLKSCCILEHLIAVDNGCDRE